MIPETGFEGRRVAIIHYWLVGMRGGERVLESLCRMFPNADIFTHVVDPQKISHTIAAHQIYTTRIAKYPFARSQYQKYIGSMPRALEELDLSGYDLIISSEAGPAKGVIVPPGVPHICYCHSPMRYVWDQYHSYHQAAGRVAKAVFPRVAHNLRQWDVTSAARVDHFVANSTHVAARIRKYWRRSADVVPPPVQVDAFHPVPIDEVEDFYLWAGALVPYKRPDIAIEAFKRLGKKLVVIGGSKAAANQFVRGTMGNVTYLGEVPFEVLKEHMAKCRALIFPGEEDFGIVPVEVMASGRPVIAYGRGGALDSVVNGKTGLFFNTQSVEALMNAIMEFEQSDLGQTCKSDCLSQAKNFSEFAFWTGMRRALRKVQSKNGALLEERATV